MKSFRIQCTAKRPMQNARFHSSVFIRSIQVCECALSYTSKAEERSLQNTVAATVQERFVPAQFPSLKSGFLLYCVGYGIREYSLKSYITLAGGRTGVANAAHLSGPERATSAMEVLPADASALVICELRWAWRGVGDSCAATARCAGHGVCSCVCDECDGCVV